MERKLKLMTAVNTLSLSSVSYTTEFGRQTAGKRNGAGKIFFRFMSAKIL